ncbi:hypothetical protein GCM10022198_10760 [Klugiella xanthotipulae]|uniref:Uncharacterized protein n=1 Tax=Klugiella xanthotipulae TaxID=244735 RepID=A0A543HYQ5_9MICO|nr:hypothetical protein [Klugiella xanthotipulae]TQM63473.1 hypothetical protein FB466_1736 [Klugiella xanthotipulae]
MKSHVETSTVQGRLTVDPGAMARVMGRAYADQEYRDTLLGSGCVSLLAEAGAVEPGTPITVFQDDNVTPWTFDVTRFDSGVLVRINVPAVDSDLTPLGEDWSFTLCCCPCCCCCP